MRTLAYSKGDSISGDQLTPSVLAILNGFIRLVYTYRTHHYNLYHIQSYPLRRLHTVLTATKRFKERLWKAITPPTEFHINMLGLIITFHSVQFLNEIMQHIAQHVTRLFETTQYVSSLGDLQSAGSDSEVFQDDAELFEGIHASKPAAR